MARGSGRSWRGEVGDEGAAGAAETATGDCINHLTEPTPVGCLQLTCSSGAGLIGTRGGRWGGEKMKEREKKVMGLIGRERHKEAELKEM